MPTCEPAGLAISMSGCSAERLEPGHLVLAGRRHDVHSGPVSCHCRDRGQGDQRHFLTGVQQGPRLPASEHAPGGLACRFPGARRYRAWKTLSRGHRRGRPLAWDGCAGHCRPCAAGGSARGPARPGRCACRSDRREAAAYVDSGPWRCAPLERTGVPQPSQRPPRSPARYGQPQSSADWRWSLTSWPANNALTLNVQFTSTRQNPAAGPPVGHDARLAPTAISDLEGRRSTAFRAIRLAITG